MFKSLLKAKIERKAKERLLCRRRLHAGKFMPCHASYLHTRICLNTVVNSIANRQRLCDDTICVSLSVLCHVLQFFSHFVYFSRNIL